MNKLSRIGFGFGIMWKVIMDIFRDFEEGAFSGYSVEFMSTDEEDEMGEFGDPEDDCED